MKQSSFSELLGQESQYSSDEYIREPFRDLSDTSFNPFNNLPPPLALDLTTPPPPKPSSTTPPASTDAGPAAVENLSSGDVPPDQPPDVPRSPQVPAEATQALVPVMPQSSTIPATSSVSPLASSALFSPTVTHTAMSVSPPAPKRRYSLVDEPDQSQEPIPGPSAPRRVKRPRQSYDGESLFQLDTAPPLEPNVPAEKPKRKSRKEKPYAACRCPDGPSQKPTRHWKDTCHSNRNAGQTRFSCEHCDKTFPTKFNKERHVKAKHW